ncbi:MAG: DNA-formamidopyrimidine glycosylase family protein, partial [Pseudomonadota bacterium]
MPELPEVETVRRGLAPVMEGGVIAQADVNRPDLRWPFPNNMAARLTGQKVLGLRRRSKYILADLQSGESLLSHLGMSGGIHRIWKDAMMDWLAPRPGQKLLDVAGGTGDISFRFLKRAGHGHATVLDLTESMLVEGQK